MEVPKGVHWRVHRGADQGVAMRSEPLMTIQLHSCGVATA